MRGRRIGVDARALGRYGIGEYLRHLVPHLAAAAPETELVVFGPGRRPPAGMAAPNLAWVRDEAPPYSLREQRALWRQSRRHGLDLLHLSHYLTPAAAGCPLVVTIHDLIHLLCARSLAPPARLYARTMLRAAARRARQVITVSEHSRADLLRHLGLPPARVAALPLGLAPEAARPPDPAADAAAARRHGLEQPFVLSVGNFRMPHKNVTGLLRAYGHLRRWGHAPLLALAGDPPQGRLGRRARALAAPWGDAVRWLGPLPHPEVLRLYGAAEAFVLASRYEGFGLPVLEAMARGAPVVACAAASVPEVAGEAAVLVPPADEAALAGALARVLADGTLAGTLRRAGPARARRFSWAAHARGTLAVYREALERR